MEISAPIPSTTTFATVSPTVPPYSLPPGRFMNEDILFCVDIDVESKTELKLMNTRLDVMKHAILFFVNAKHSICPDHRFCFSILSETFSWLRKEFTNDVNLAAKAIRSLTAFDRSCGSADLTSLFQVAKQESIKSHADGRLFRVILIYCRSSAQPVHRWPVSEKAFTMDVLYLHDKPGPENCPQKVFDSLLDVVEHVSQYEGYVFENGQGSPRALFRQMCLLLCHPMQRCLQEDLDIPKSIIKKTSGSTEGAIGDEGKQIQTR